MATTTTTTWTSAILSEALAERAIPANLPKQVVINLVNQDSIDGQATKTKQYPVLTDLGAASSLTEGTDIAATTTLAYGRVPAWSTGRSPPTSTASPGTHSTAPPTPESTWIVRD